MKVKEFNEKKIYSDGNGIVSFVEPNIKTRLNEYGIYEEVINKEDDFELSSKVEMVSTYLNSELNETIVGKSLFSNISNIKYDERIGYYLSSFIGHVNEGNYREIGSSGGTGTWILKELYERDLIDAVIHVKKNKDKNSDILFKYEVSESVKEIQEGSKTKYYPVELSNVLNYVKSHPKRYAIVGIPSFIYGIRLLQEVDPDIKERIVYTIGLICGHQKSSKFAESMAWSQGIKPGDLIDINFRKKLVDQPANKYAVEFIGFVNGEIKNIIKPTSELIGQNWGMGYFKQYSSDFTDDVFNETADITIGDAWLKPYSYDSKGNSIIICRNKVIDGIIKDSIRQNKLNMEEKNIEVIYQSQSSHYKHTKQELAYRLYKLDSKRIWRPKKRVEASNKISDDRRKIQDLREEISTKSHHIYKQALEKKDFSYFENSMINLNEKYRNLYRKQTLKELGLFGIIKKIIDKFVIKK